MPRQPQPKNGRLDLGRLGVITVTHTTGEGWWWHNSLLGATNLPNYCTTEDAAWRSAVRWLRAALQQAAKKIGGE